MKFFAFFNKHFETQKENPTLPDEELGLLAFDDLTGKSKKDHQSIVKTLDNQDDALCLVVLGGISIIVSILFFILSFKRKFNKLVGIDTASLQFYVCVACGIIGITLLALGLVFVFANLKNRVAYKKEIAAIAKLKDKMADNK